MKSKKRFKPIFFFELANSGASTGREQQYICGTIGGSSTCWKVIWCQNNYACCLRLWYELYTSEKFCVCLRYPIPESKFCLFNSLVLHSLNFIPNLLFPLSTIYWSLSAVRNNADECRWTKKRWLHVNMNSDYCRIIPMKEDWTEGFRLMQINAYYCR